MEGEAGAAIVKVLVQNLVNVINNEISLVRGVHKEAQKLAWHLVIIQEFLNDAEKRTIPGGAIKTWLKSLEDVAFDADNVLDELNYHILSKKIKIVKPMKETVLSCFNTIARSRNMALRIKNINANLESIYKKGVGLGLRRLAAHVPTTSVASETDAFTLDPIFIGRDYFLWEIVGNLTTIITSGERQISILAIAGMGGLGKTTLTRKVFHHEKTQALFGSHIWVHVSQIFDPVVLFEKILKGLTSSDQIEAKSREDILRKLQQALKDKTYLLVLDDTWNEDLPKWEEFINCLSGVTSTKGNAIVITTRIMKVASIMSPLHKYELKELSEEDCFSIIKEMTFGKEDFPSEFNDIGKKIAKRCQGLPLAAKVVGGVLRNKSKEEWFSIEQEWLSHDDSDNITKILRLSFDNLSSPSLKKCFAYCSIFPKGLMLKKQELIEYWMAEGFLGVDGTNEMELVGDKFISILVHNSLLQVAERDDYGNVRVCVMQDFVHDVACSVLGSNNNEDGMRIRYITHEKKSGPIKTEKAKYFRTLLLEDRIDRNMFSDFESLHSLTLQSHEFEELPSTIKKLMHLRILNITLTRIAHLPDWIGELFHLQTLRAESIYLRQLPCTLKYLSNLRHLYINWDMELPAEIGRLTCLRTLRHFRVGYKNGCKIEELGSLKNLEGELNIYSLERVHNKEEAEKASLSEKSKILELRLGWGREREGKRNDENVLEGLQPHSGLKKLAIDGFQGKRFPSWTRIMAVWGGPQGSWAPLENLIQITLLECSECVKLPMFGQLPNLKSLELERLYNMKCIDSTFYGLVNGETRIVFPALEKLVLHWMPELEEWAQVESVGASDVKVFPQLQHLEITYCSQLTTFPNHFGPCLKHLIIRRIGSYKPLANIFETELTSLTELCLAGIYDLECLPDSSFSSIPNLSKLEIKNCPNLRGLPDGLRSINSVKKLIIWGCPALEDIGVKQSQGSVTSLRRLEIRECDALQDLPCEMVGSSLEQLVLENLSSLKNLGEIIDRLPKSRHLTYLEIVGVPKFKTTCSVENWPFGSLERTTCSVEDKDRPFGSLKWLVIDVSMGGSVETVDGLLKGCSDKSLGDLRLKGMEGWENLPESIQHLTALEYLTIKNFGVERLPEWLGNLSSLWRLDLYSCEKLRRLPDAMPSLTTLKRLSINGCPELRTEQQSDAADSQWPKISHIPDIWIDGSYLHVVHKERTRK